MFELKTSLESCTEAGRDSVLEVIHFIASQGVGKRELLAEALLKETSSICGAQGIAQRAVCVPLLDCEAWEDEAARDEDAAFSLGFGAAGFSESCVDALVDFVAFLAALPQEEQDAFSNRLLEIAEQASSGIDEAARKDRLSNG